MHNDMRAKKFVLSSQDLSQKVVIIGAACRFPGCDSLQEYWQNLLAGTCCTAPVERWEQTETPAWHGGLLKHVDSFDAAFFHTSPNEACCMDPQQRLLMEVAQQAIDDCGLSVETLRELCCGVYCTGLPGDYKFLMLGDREATFSSHSFLGNAAASLSGRISYFYDFHGPSLTLDTACSSSLTALHIAFSQLRSGECGAALLGGVAVFSTDEVFKFAQRSNMLSVKGYCDVFGQGADGFVPAEGVAAIIMTTAARAQALGVEVLACIEGIALNHDGMSNGMMAPNSQAQAELIAGTYERFGIPVCQVGYVEAHGTGTRLGDALEVSGLVSAFQARDPEYRAYLGASKRIIGHTLVCSGLANVLKTMMILRQGIIPGQPMSGGINRELKLDRFVINPFSQAWPEDKNYAAVSAFGFTGSNAHLVMGRPFRTEDSHEFPKGPWPFILSAHSPSSLQARLKQLLELLEHLPTNRLGTLSMALGRGNQQQRIRVAVSAADSNTLSSSLTELLRQPAECLNAECSILRVELPEAQAARVRDWLAGANVALYSAEQCASTVRVDLPPYPFDRKSYWVGERLGVAASFPATSMPLHHVLGKLKDELAQLLGFDPADIDSQRSLREYGVDSILLIQLLARFGPLATQMQPHDVFEYPTLEALAEALAEIQTKTHRGESEDACSIPRLHMRWQQFGQGRPILLLPPLNMTAKAWVQQIAVLKKEGYAVHIPTYPGHLGNPMEERDFGLTGLVAELRIYIDEQLRGSIIPIVGWSLGGCLALELARQAPHTVASLLLISTVAKFSDELFAKTIELHDELHAYSDCLDILLEPRQSIAEQVGAGASMQVLKHYYQMLEMLDFEEALPSINTRTLIVHGKRDVVIDAADAAVLRCLPKAGFIEFEEYGHFIPLVAARQFNALMLNFLQGSN